MNKPNCVNLVVLIPFAMNLTKHVWPQNQKRNKLNFVLKMSLLGLIIFHVVIFFIPSPIWYFLCFRTSNCRHHGACNKNMKTFCYLLHSAEKASFDTICGYIQWETDRINYRDVTKTAQFFGTSEAFLLCTWGCLGKGKMKKNCIIGNAWYSIGY